MNLKKFTFLFLLLTFFISTSVKAQWIEKNNGLIGSRVISIKTMGANVFAGTHGAGVFLSSDNGNSWASVGPANVDVTALLADGSNLYAGTSTGIYVTSNSGTTWTALNNGLSNTAVSSLVMNSSTFLVGTFGGGVFLSTNKGANWSAINGTGLTQNWITSVTVKGTSIFAGTLHGVFVSNNNGTSWISANTGLTNLTCATMMCNGTDVFVGTQSNGGNGGVSIYNASNGSWTAINNGITDLNILSLAYRGSELFAGSGSGLFVSTDNGATWIKRNIIIHNSSVNSIESNGPFLLFLGSGDEGVSTSLNDGLNWTTDNENGMVSPYVPGILAVGSNVFCGVYVSGLFVSSNSGTNWTKVGAPFFQLWSSSFASNASNIYVGGRFGQGGAYSSDGGATWTAWTQSGANTDADFYCLALVGSSLFAGTTNHGVLVSLDNGATWTQVNSGLPPNTPIYSLVVNSAGTSLFAGTGAGVFVSSDNGATWKASNNGISSTPIQTLVVLGTNIFAGTTNGVFLSTDNGSNWTAVNNGLVSADVRTLAVNGSSIFAGTYGGGIFVSANNGAGWIPFNSGLTNLRAASFGVDNTNLYVGTDGKGVFSRALADFSVPVTSFSPSKGSVGNQVNIKGKNFSPIPGITKVKFGGVLANIVGIPNDSTLLVNVPVGGITGKITVEVAGLIGTSLTDFTVTVSPPSIISFAPTSGPVGTSVTITGTNFSTTPNSNIVYFGATAAVVTSATATQLKVTVPVGATYKPITVTTNGFTAFSAAPFNVTYLGGLALGGNSLSLPSNLNAGDTPMNVAIGDLDGDGKSDLVIANQKSNSISILRNTGSSGSISSTSFASKVDINTGLSPWFVVLGDIDSDGKLDIIVSNSGSGTFSIFKNISSSGSLTTNSFAARVDFSTGSGSRPFKIAIGDLDGDGRTDVAVINYLSALSIFQNVGLGSINSSTFAPSVDLTLPGSYTSGLVIKDLDGDSKPDLAAVNPSLGTFSVFQNKINGPGTITSNSFASKVDFSTSIAPGGFPTGIEAEDLDGDGLAEIILVENGNSAVSIFHNKGTSGLFNSNSFDLSVEFGVGSNPILASIADVDGDGKLDIAVTNNGNGSISVLRNTSSLGSFTSSSFNKVDWSVGGGTSLGIAVGDLDGDGRPDLAATTQFNSVAIFRNTNLFVQPPAISSFSPSSGSAGTSVVIKGTNFNATPANNIVFFGASKAVVTDASSTQISVTVPSGATYQPISLTTNGLTTFSKVPFNLTAINKLPLDASSFSVSSKAILPTPLTPVTVALSDVDSDSKLDLAVTSTNTSNGSPNYLSLFQNIATLGSITTGSFSTSLDLITPNGAAGFIVIDLDSDGLPDIIAGDGAFQNSGSSFGTSIFNPLQRTGGANGEYGVVGDLDLDGRPDLVWNDAPNNVITLYRNTSLTGSLSGSFLSTGVKLSPGFGPRGIVIGDLDNDGKPEIIVSNINSNTVSIFRNTAVQGVSYGFSFDVKFDLPVGLNPIGIALGDLDLDGSLDIIVVNNSGPSISVLKNKITSPGSFTSSSFAAKVDFVVGQEPVNVVIGNIDGDGRPDIVVSGGKSTTNNIISVFRNVSTQGSFTSSSLGTRIDISVGTTTGTFDPKSTAIGDIDGDGLAELVVSDPLDKTVSVFLNKIANAPAPSITTFNPTSGAIGTPVTISGLNFDASQANNTVKFNGTTAIITASSTTSITTTVPVGASSGKITVAVNGQQTTSAADFVVSKTDQTITFGTLPNKSSTDAPFTLSATASSGLAVTYASSNAGVATVSGNTVTIVGAGSTDITASQTGNANYNAAPDVIQKLTINDASKTNQTITFSVLPSKRVGDPAFTLSATASSGLAITYVSSNTGVATISGNTVTIISAGTTTITASQAGNANFNAAANVAQVLTVTLADTTPPVVSANTTPTGSAPNTAIGVSVTFTDAESGIKSAKLLYRPIAGASPNNYIAIDMTAPTSGSIYTASIPATAVSELGVEYKFLVTNGAGLDNSANQTLYEISINLLSGTTVTSYPTSAAGSTADHYRIIAVPFTFTDNTANGIFSNALGSYDSTKWRILTYNSSKATANFPWDELTGTSQIKQGTGYWFITNVASAITLGAGTTPTNVTSDGGFPIALNQGWNQIGNPYNFNISWTDVLNANPSLRAALSGNVRVYRGTTLNEDEDILRSFEGGFVRFTGATGTTMKIPAAKNNTAQSGRVATTDGKVLNSLDQPAWELMLSLKNGEATNNTGGVGMSPDANESFDSHDDFNAPHFVDYLELKFPKTFAGMTFTKDVVALTENHVWNFSVESNLAEESTSLSWNNSYFGNGKEIFLVDLTSYRTINMATETSYSFDKSHSKNFKVVFGSSTFVKSELIPTSLIVNEPYPNPTSGQVTIDFALPAEATVVQGTVKVVNSKGEVILTNATPPQAGSNQLLWDSSDQSSGLYLISVQIGNQTVTKKIVKR